MAPMIAVCPVELSQKYHEEFRLAPWKYHPCKNWIQEKDSKTRVLVFQIVGILSRDEFYNHTCIKYGVHSITDRTPLWKYIESSWSFNRVYLNSAIAPFGLNSTCKTTVICG